MRRQEPPCASGDSSQSKADFVFCVDATGSMAPCFERLKNVVKGFSDRLQDTDNVDYRLRLIAYRDRHDPRDGTPWGITEFTSLTEEFNVSLSELGAFGGSERMSSTLDAIYAAVHSDWRNNAIKIIVCLTDNDTHPTLHRLTYAGRDNDVYRVIQDFQTLRHSLLFLIAPESPLYAEIVRSIEAEDAKRIVHFFRDAYSEKGHPPALLLERFLNLCLGGTHGVREIRSRGED